MNKKRTYFGQLTFNIPAGDLAVSTSVPIVLSAINKCVIKTVALVSICTLDSNDAVVAHNSVLTLELPPSAGVPDKEPSPRINNFLICDTSKQLDFNIEIKTNYSITVRTNTSLVNPVADSTVSWFVIINYEEMIFV